MCNRLIEATERNTPGLSDSDRQICSYCGIVESEQRATFGLHHFGQRIAGSGIVRKHAGRMPLFSEI
jgi:hypothetical protein